MSTLRTHQTTVLRKVLLIANRDGAHDMVDITSSCSTPSGQRTFKRIRSSVMPTLAEATIELSAHSQTIYAEVWRSWIPGPDAGQRVERYPDEYTMPAQVTTAIHEFFAGLPRTVAASNLL